MVVCRVRPVARPGLSASGIPMIARMGSMVIVASGHLCLRLTELAQFPVAAIGPELRVLLSMADTSMKLPSPTTWPTCRRSSPGPRRMPRPSCCRTATRPAPAARPGTAGAERGASTHRQERARPARRVPPPPRPRLVARHAAARPYRDRDHAPAARDRAAPRRSRRRGPSSARTEHPGEVRRVKKPGWPGCAARAAPPAACSSVSNRTALADPHFSRRVPLPAAITLKS